MTTRDGIIALGIRLGADVRESTKRRFYVAVSTFLPSDDNKKMRAEADKLSVAGIAKKLGIPQADVKTLPDSVKSAAFPSGATIIRMVGYVRRFPNADPDTSLEVYATAAAAALRDAKALNPDKTPDRVAVDKEAVALVTDATAAMGETLSIRDARNAFQTPSVKNTPANGDSPDTVGDRVDWLLTQRGAVEAYAETDDHKLTELAAMLAEILS